MPAERRSAEKGGRRMEDDCTQCPAIKCRLDNQDADAVSNKESIESAHQRIDNCVTYTVFVILTVAYLSIAAWQVVEIGNISKDVSALKAQMSYVMDSNKTGQDGKKP